MFLYRTVGYLVDDAWPFELLVQLQFKTAPPRPFFQGDCTKNLLILW